MSRNVPVTAALAAIASATTMAGQIMVTDRSVDTHIAFMHKPLALAIPGPQDWMPAGIAIADYNNDGWQDIFWASGGGSTPDHLFINNGDGTFVDQAAAWGLTDIHAACGACAGDYNDDGFLDIYVTSFGNGTNNQGQVGKNRLYRNNGNGTFTNVAEAAGVAFTGLTIASGYGCCFGDYDLDGDLDLAIAAWYAPAKANRLYRNNGDGTFTDVTTTALTIPPTTWGFQTRFADMDHDGWPDLLLSADFGTSRYYRNNGNGTFSDLTESSGTGQDQNGMGQCIGDFNNDGMLDWYVTSIFLDVQQPASGEGNKLYINTGSPGNHTYVETSVAAGVANGGWGWGTVAVDLDQDGWLDIVEVNGRPSNAEFTGEQEYLWHNNTDGTFTEMALPSGLTYKAEGKSLATVDFDRDGDMDFLITFNNDLVKLYRNDSNGGNWLSVALDTPNNPLLAPNGFGARVVVTAGGHDQVRVIDSAPSFLNTGEFAAHFGLGQSTTIDKIRIEWPRGYVSTLEHVDVNQFLALIGPSLADLSADGVVDGADLAMLIDRWGAVGLSADRKADVNNDGVVDGVDLGILLDAWGTR
ncbi:MAG: FG-GAP-like repeat-containing protein [Phycisphaerales bacterium]